MGAALRVGGVARPELRARLAAAGVALNQHAERLFEDPRFGTAAAPSRVHVVAVDVAALGFPDGATFAQITSAASALRLAVCPLELGPHLRLRYFEPEDAPTTGEVRGAAPPGALTVASQPPDDDDDVPWGFYLRRICGVPWLRGYRCWSGHVWAPGDVFAFARFRAADRE